MGFGWGLGTAVGLGIIVGGFLWYESRPKPPKPPKQWNRSAIKAEYDRVDTEGDKNTIVFYYTLENTTDFDYRVENGENISVNANLEKERSLTHFDEMESIDYPIIVPTKKRVRIGIHLGGYPCPVKPKENPNAEERKEHRTAVEKYVVDELTDLDGFDLLDEANRYEIFFPSGWKKTSQQP